MAVGRPSIARAAVLTLVGVCVAVVMAACGGGEQQHSERKLSDRQRDSLLATQPLPGAGVVGRALGVADSAAARAAREIPEGE